MVVRCFELFFVFVFLYSADIFGRNKLPCKERSDAAGHKLYKWQCSKAHSQIAYLRSLLSYDIPAHSLCSSNTSLLSIPRVHTTFASCGFSIAARSVWNSHPVGIHACSSPHIFHHLLKTHCFDQAFSIP